MILMGWVLGKLACPADNVFFCFFVEIPLTERGRVKGLEELPNVVDPKLDHLRWSIDIISPQLNALPRRHHVASHI